MTDTLARQDAAKWLVPVAGQLNAFGYSFKHHFGRTYDGSFGELVTDVHDVHRVRVIWMDLNSSPDTVWVKLYFSSVQEQQRAFSALRSAPGHLLANSTIESRKSTGYETCPWMLNLSIRRDVVDPDHVGCALTGWLCAMLALAETASAVGSHSAAGI